MVLPFIYHHFHRENRVDFRPQICFAVNHYFIFHFEYQRKFIVELNRNFNGKSSFIFNVKMKIFNFNINKNRVFRTKYAVNLIFVK